MFLGQQFASFYQTELNEVLIYQFYHGMFASEPAIPMEQFISKPPSRVENDRGWSNQHNWSSGILSSHQTPEAPFTNMV